MVLGLASSSINGVTWAYIGSVRYCIQVLTLFDRR